MARKKRKRARTFTPIKFGYDDGRADTVLLILEGARLTLEGELLQRVTAAYFSVHDFAVSPSLRSLGLKKTIWATPRRAARAATARGNYVVQDSLMRDGRKGPLHISMSIFDGYLRLWVQSTVQRLLYFNIYFSKVDAEEFGRRLAEASEWDIGS
jgi:hypothetical protein